MFCIGGLAENQNLLLCRFIFAIVDRNYPFYLKRKRLFNCHQRFVFWQYSYTVYFLCIHNLLQGCIIHREERSFRAIVCLTVFSCCLVYAHKELISANTSASSNAHNSVIYKTKFKANHHNKLLTTKSHTTCSEENSGLYELLLKIRNVSCSWTSLLMHESA